MNNKKYKGILGLDTVKAVMLTILILAVMAIAVFVILINLQSTYESSTSVSGTPISNETFTGNSTVGTALSANTNYRNCVATVGVLTNATNGAVVPTTNYTTSGCTVTIVGSLYDGLSLNASYTFTYDYPYANNLINNVTSGTTSFFTQVPTFFVLLGVVVLILIIAIVIVAISRFSPETKGVVDGL